MAHSRLSSCSEGRLFALSDRVHYSLCGLFVKRIFRETRVSVKLILHFLFTFFLHFLFTFFLGDSDASTTAFFASIGYLLNSLGRPHGLNL